MKKAYELSILCDCEIALIIFNSGNITKFHRVNAQNLIPAKFAPFEVLLKGK